MMPGGTGDEKTADNDVQALVDSVKDAVITKLGSQPQEMRATHYKTQVVAGMNYFVRVHIGDGKHIHLRIYKHFSGTVNLHGVKHHEAGGVAESEQLEYFEKSRTMSWTLDTSGHLVSDGGQVTFTGEVKGDTKGNAIWMDSGDEIKEGSRSWRFTIGSGKGMWIGLGTEERFGPGYRLKGLLYGGPGNLSDGGSLVTGGWGPRFAEGDTVDMRMTLTANGSLSLEFGLNNSYLGTAFSIDNWTWGQARPVISLSSTGASVTITSIKDEQFPKSESPSSSEGITGKWTCVTEDYSLSLSPMEGSSSVLGLSVRVGNSMNCQIEAKEDGSWVMAGPAMTTQMMPPPQVYELEKKVFALFNNISNISRDGAGLRVSFKSRESHSYQPQARAGPATREKVHWMN